MIELRFNLQKEFLEALRTKKLMVLGIVALLFSLLDPIMLKLTPYLLKEIGGIDMSDMIQLTHQAELKEFNTNIYQLFTIVLVIIIGNVWLNEVKQQTLVIPVSKGLKLSSIMLAKIMTYVLSVNVFIYVAYTINYYYSGIIFGFSVEYYQVLSSAALMGVFYSFCIVLIIALGPIISNFPGIVFTTLLIVFSGPFITSLLNIGEYTPFGLIKEATMFPRILSSTVISNIIYVAVLSSIIYYIGIFVAEKKEIIKYR